MLEIKRYTERGGCVVACQSCYGIFPMDIFTAVLSHADIKHQQAWPFALITWTHVLLALASAPIAPRMEEYYPSCEFMTAMSHIIRDAP